ncbi:FAM172 family protein homolog CG10038 isoform X2 [Ischnura elegans]|nr:FAM172 family protein homolog CG10038 isoform X2 [Ischnura elegans]XP_046401125.1 FAM172 family protein homolog CG10038 isoform X2 [Ischnura elegans]XP_046401126.1 FAM172 family protein homolog CG10038 isoform X2 [Ischnura elegans]XP_046401127.1 FAM172 family protein homolog CG10038 isoform X2 [Ischnura elegans]XP_046401128.1 FAM172 family protein homolog CG10038 isoform X2 [Ischnura elegans]XP_046401129.1 FAM172 family protein homolog CG10038 isoform X2 [Ischnura elegans]XP_046401130.1 FA
MAAGSLGTGFPANLKGFGYGFSKEGKLRKLEKSTGEPGEEGFQFQVSDDGDYNQRHYEALGDVITEYVYDLLETEVGLVRLPVPVNPDHPSTFIFASPNALTADAPLVILVHGSGVVRAGQWARSLIINDSLQSGTQIPYIKKAREMGYEVLITNSNENSKVINGKRIAIKGSSNAVAHVSYVWKNYIQGAKSNQVLIVAHSYGGHCIVELAREMFPSFKSKVVAVAMTDSVHRLSSKHAMEKYAKFLSLASRNWVSSDLPLDEPESTREGEIPRVSAGTVKHELTSWSCLQSVFAFFEAALRRTRRHDDL